jgi:hypothetical protein
MVLLSVITIARGAALVVTIIVMEEEQVEDTINASIIVKEIITSSSHNSTSHIQGLTTGRTTPAVAALMDIDHLGQTATRERKDMVAIHMVTENEKQKITRNESGRELLRRASQSIHAIPGTLDTDRRRCDRVN